MFGRCTAYYKKKKDKRWGEFFCTLWLPGHCCVVAKGLLGVSLVVTRCLKDLYSPLLNLLLES